MTIWIWIGFILLVMSLMALDLGLLGRRAHVIRVREALRWTAFFITTALAFNVLIYFMYEHHWLGIGLGPRSHASGRDAAMAFFTGWVVEYSLSLDNIFVFAVIFSYFAVPPVYQHRVLFWGILGALVMRGAMIAAGAALIKRFDWIIYVFGALLIVTAVKMLLSRDEAIQPEKNIFLRMARRFFPVSTHYDGRNFFTQIDGMRAITPLFLVLVVVESTDVLFAVDSIPAIFAITTDPFIVFTSNVFAILGLRSLYFALAGMMDKFRYLKASLMLVLIFVGVKMLLSHHVEVPTPMSLAVIVGILTTGIVSSLIVSKRDGDGNPPLAD